jgi:hypothetical protein
MKSLYHKKKGISKDHREGQGTRLRSGNHFTETLNRAVFLSRKVNNLKMSLDSVPEARVPENPGRK